MIKSKIKDIVGLSYIRCLTKEEFGKILELCESELSIDEWDIFDTYTIYDDTKDETYKAFKGVDEILASDVIKEFNNKMKKENFIKTYENNFIRCVSKEEFNEILTIFEKQLNSNRWELFAHYTLYNPVADNCLKLIGDKEYYDAKYIIDEYNGVGFLFEDGEKIVQNSLNDIKEIKKELEKVYEKEKVNHPNHYGGEDNPYEAIKIIEAHDLNFVEGNVVKYLLRYKLKNGFEDLQKALWYMNRLVQNHKL